MFKTFIWFIKNPRYTPHIFQILKRNNNSQLEDTREESAKWCQQNCISQEEALKKLTGKKNFETHEVEVLEGYIKYIKKELPALLIEIIRDKVAIGIENLIKDLDYHYFAINEKTGPIKVDSLLKREGYNFLICNGQTANKLDLL